MSTKQSKPEHKKPTKRNNAEARVEVIVQEYFVSPLARRLYPKFAKDLVRRWIPLLKRKDGESLYGEISSLLPEFIGKKNSPLTFGL